MSIRNRLILITAVLSAAIGAFTAFYIQHGLSSKSSAADIAHPLIGTLRPDFSLYDLNDNSTSISIWDGRMVLINFWAAWCPPCRREIPVFNEVREFYSSHGFEVIGIAIDEKDKVVDFLESIPAVQYPQLIGFDDALKVASAFGNRSGGLPYSVLLDKQGIIRYVKAGELSQQTLMTQIELMLKSDPQHINNT